MERWACADVPSLALQILLEAHSDWRPHPVAVVDRDTAQGVILQSNRHARQFQIKPGLRYAAGLSLNRTLRAAVVDKDEVGETCTRLIEELRKFSPHVEADSCQPGLFWLRATGLDRLFGGFDVWAQKLFDQLRDSLGLLVSVTVGWTRFGTFATSRSEPAGWRLFESLESETQHLDRVPLDVLGLPTRVADKLDKLAISNVAQFLALPPSGVRKRFGPEAAQLWRFANGGAEIPLQPLEWTQPVERSFDLDDAMWDMTQLTFLLKGALHPLMLELAGRHCDLRELSIRLVLEDGDSREISVRPATPTLDEVRIVELCRLKFERCALPAPIVRLEFEALGVMMHRDQGHLLRDNAKRDLQVASHALARLRAEYGDESVCKVVLRERHLPEAKFSLEPFDALRRPNPSEAPRPSLVRRVFDRPHPLPRFDPEIGFGWLVRDLDEGLVMRSFGPFRVSGGWWMDGQSAAEHIVLRRRADTSTHHVSPRARYFSRDGEFVEPAEASMSAVAPHRGEILTEPARRPKRPSTQTRPTRVEAVGVSRDYWYAETDRGDVFWVYWDHRRRQWFLHGVVE